jgi:phosphoribosylaminoimidazolecarboxamide formyltransferase/IMP cyclohydrolase
MTMTDRLHVGRALISVSDKTGLLPLAHALAAHGAEILSTGGTAQALRAAGIAVTDVAAHTGFPEILDGRVKTLLPQIHGGLLARRDSDTHRRETERHGIVPIDLVAVNLYPFEATVAAGADFSACVENIDIGGPAMIRSAAKNHEFVSVLTDPAQYAEFQAALDAGGTTMALRRALAAAAFARTAAYDAAIAAWFAHQQGEVLPERLTLAATRVQSLRYGENPHQHAAFYRTGGEGLAAARQVQGKELSYNNLADTDAALDCLAEFDGPACVIVKHANPCGVAQADTVHAAWTAALRADPVSAFGGIVALNRTLDEATAAAIAEIFTEVVAAPDATEAALGKMSRRKAVRLLLTGALPEPDARDVLVRSVRGGLLAQTRDTGRVAVADWRIVTRRAPDEALLSDLQFAWRVCKHVKSNAIVLARQGATLGIGAGQTSRLDAARIAVERSGEAARGAVAASDAFFPFADGLEVLAASGVAAVLQPGGSLRDAEVIAAADAAGLAMAFTGMRHFRH